MDINKNTFMFAVIMRNIVATIMLFLYLTQWGFKNAVVVLYSYYQDEIASNYCENRFSNQTNLDPLLINKIPLTEQEKNDIIAFLKTLTDPSFIRDKRFSEF